jgi:DeoR/GlpR family transcriptional regulator of sugar metabolism
VLAEQRHLEILKRLQLGGAVRVRDLAQVLDVTDETIRRDLEKLGRAGRLIRTHGGAMPLPEGSRDVPYTVRRSRNHEAKVAIAAVAVGHIKPGDVIALDASSTVHELTRLIPDQPLTVVTNSLLASVRLLNCPQVRVLATGGLLDPTTCSWTGSVAEQALERVNIEKLFFSSKGLDLERGLSEADDSQARLKRQMLDLAAKRYLLLDHSKLNARSIVLLADISRVDVLITDAAADPQILEEIAQHGIRIETAPLPASAAAS